MRRGKSALDQVEVASPCSASWEEMAGDERVRFCDHCALNVYNLSAMGRKEAEALIREHEGRLCIRYYRRRDGTLLTENCPVGLRRARQRLKLIAGAAASLAAPLFGLRPAPQQGAMEIVGRRARPEPTQGQLVQIDPPREERIVQGKMAPPRSSSAPKPPKQDGSVVGRWSESRYRRERHAALTSCT